MAVQGSPAPSALLLRVRKDRCGQRRSGSEGPCVSEQHSEHWLPALFRPSRPSHLPLSARLGH